MNAVIQKYHKACNIWQNMRGNIILFVQNVVGIQPFVTTVLAHKVHMICDCHESTSSQVHCWEVSAGGALLYGTTEVPLLSPCTSLWPDFLNVKLLS